MEISQFIIKSQINSENESALHGLEMVYVESGSFMMGGTEQDSDCNENEKPTHKVTVDSFSISKTLITQSQWKSIMGNNPSYWQGDNLPVECVSYDDVLEFIQKLNRKTGESYRLPTEAEWEYAARGGSSSGGYRYAGSNNPDDVAWFSHNGEDKTHLVGTKQPNELGLYDMNGNVWEWVNDWYEKVYYSKSPEHNPTGPETGIYRVLRGGRFGSPIDRCRIASRSLSESDRRCNAHGFRLVLSQTDVENILLFNALTKAMVTLSIEQYEQIFEKADFSNEHLIKKLYKLGFIVDSNEQEILQFEREKDERLSRLNNSITILTTTNCNANCFYCFEDGIKKCYTMTEETANGTVSFITNYFKDKQLYILWFGGEPLLNFDMIKLITLKLKEYGFTLNAHVVTNLSLLTKQMVDFFKANYSNVSFEIPIDDVDEKYYNVKKYIDLTAKNAFNHIIENVKMLLDNKIFVSISINYVVSKVGDVKNAYFRLKDLLSNYSDSEYYLFFTPLSLKGNSELITNYTGEMRHPYLQLVDLRLQNCPEKNNDFLLNTLALIPKKPCEIAAEKMMVIVNAEGSIYNCIRLVGRENFRIGNVFNGIKDKDKTLKLQESVHNPKTACKNCNILPICQGGCVAKKILFGDEHECHKTKQVQSDLVRIYYNELQKINSGV